jgi:hypothetical protein
MPPPAPPRQLGGPLTARDAWASTFEHVLGDTLRTDCPMSMPDVSPPAEDEMQNQLDREVRSV